MSDATAKMDRPLRTQDDYAAAVAQVERLWGAEMGRLYDTIGHEFAAHETVHHASGEYARGKGPQQVTTNTVEGLFGVFKRGMTGVYQHCGEQHLQRYLDEFTFRYNHRVKLGVGDQERARIATHAMNHKRLTYRRIDDAQDAAPIG